MTWPWTWWKRWRIRRKHQKEMWRTIRLMETWLNDPSHYDEKVWPVLKESIEKHRLSARPRFEDTKE